MFTEPRWEKINQFARERVSGNDSYHDIEHILRTADTAVRLAIAERADQGICWAAAMLHDICKKEQGDHAAEGAKQAKKFLMENGVDEKSAERVRDAIHFHNKDFDDSAPLERKILWDADKLYIVTPDGFRKRMLPYWIMRKGRKEGIETAVSEYHFYMGKFHTETGRKEARKYSAEMEKLMESLKREG
jgi:uncharacterized protein